MTEARKRDNVRPALALIACAVSAMLLASCTTVDDAARVVAQKWAQRAGVVTKADDLAAALRSAATSSSKKVDEIAALADEIYEAPRLSRVLVNATSSAESSLPLISREVIEDFALGATCSTLDKVLADEEIDPFLIASQEAAAAGIPPLQVIFLVDTVREISADLQAGDTEVATRRVELLLRCFNAGR